MGKIYKYLLVPYEMTEDEVRLCAGLAADFELSLSLLFYDRTPNSRREARVVIPSDLHLSFLLEFHDAPIFGHLGSHKTLARVQEA